MATESFPVTVIVGRNRGSVRKPCMGLGDKPSHLRTPPHVFRIGGVLPQCYARCSGQQKPPKSFHGPHFCEAELI